MLATPAAALLSAAIALAAPPGKGAALLAEAPAGVRARVQASADAARAHLARPAPRAPLSRFLERDLKERFGALSTRQLDVLRALVFEEVARVSAQPGQDWLLQAFQPEQGQARAVARVLQEEKGSLLAVLRGLKPPAR